MQVMNILSHNFQVSTLKLSKEDAQVTKKAEINHSEDDRETNLTATQRAMDAIIYFSHLIRALKNTQKLINMLFFFF